MKTSRLFTKTLLLFVILFGVIATATSILSGWTLYRSLTAEFRSKGIAIAQGIADSSAEILLNRDLSTVQAVVDQFREISGVAYVFVTDSQGEIVTHTFVPAVPDEVRPMIERSMAQPSHGEVVTETLSMKNVGDFIHIYAPILAGVAGFVHVGMNRSFILAQIWATVIKQQALVFVIFLMSIGIAYLLTRRISRPLNQLADYTRSFASQDFDADVAIPAEIETLPQKSNDEIGKLAESFINMKRTLQRYLENLKETTASKERIESELKIAHDIQMSMVPKTFPPFPDRREFDIYATLIPAREVGGDFYDFFFLDEHRLCFAVGDVSGKGVPASLFMALTKTMFRATGGRQNASAQTIVTRLNSEICRDNETCMFVTFFCAILNVATGELEYSNAGHNLPYVLAEGSVSALSPTGGMALGVTETAQFKSNRILLKPGDRLVLYTDGVTEATDRNDDQFSELRLEKSLLAMNCNTSQKVVVELVAQVHRFAGGAPQSDDITLLVLGYNGSSKREQMDLFVELTNDLDELERLNRLVNEFAEQHSLDGDLVFRVTLVLEEVFTNIVSYGYDDATRGVISVRLFWNPPQMTLEIEDDGRAFNPLEVAAPNLEIPLSDKKVGGLGIHLVRQMMDELTYRRDQGKNSLRLVAKMRKA